MFHPGFAEQLSNYSNTHPEIAGGHHLISYLIYLAQCEIWNWWRIVRKLMIAGDCWCITQRTHFPCCNRSIEALPFAKSPTLQWVFIYEQIAGSRVQNMSHGYDLDGGSHKLLVYLFPSDLSGSMGCSEAPLSRIFGHDLLDQTTHVAKVFMIHGDMSRTTAAWSQQPVQVSGQPDP